MGVLKYGWVCTEKKASSRNGTVVHKFIALLLVSAFPFIPFTSGTLWPFGHGVGGCDGKKKIPCLSFFKIIFFYMDVISTLNMRTICFRKCTVVISALPQHLLTLMPRFIFFSNPINLLFTFQILW